jgi:hypothetical protein
MANLKFQLSLHHLGNDDYVSELNRDDIFRTIGHLQTTSSYYIKITAIHIKLVTNLDLLD